jgi:hypothetical protein
LLVAAGSGVGHEKTTRARATRTPDAGPSLNLTGLHSAVLIQLFLLLISLDGSIVHALGGWRNGRRRPRNCPPDSSSPAPYGGYDFHEKWFWNSYALAS